ncbi:MAG: CHASE domain-containing protein [Leptolyngbyaceae cyanobacterium]
MASAITPNVSISLGKALRPLLELMGRSSLPICCHKFAKKSYRRIMIRPRLRQTLITGITASIGIGVSILATVFVHRWEVSQQQNRFQQQVDNLAIALQRSLNRYTSVLIFLNDHYSVDQGQVQRSEFATFVARSLSDYPGIQALEWAPFVPLSERTAYEQQMQAAGFADFQITELGTEGELERAGDRPYYLPVTYLAPLAGNEAALGFDLNSTPARVAAIESARDSGNIQATGRIRLVQEQRDQYGFLVMLPLYQTGAAPASSAARREQFSGILLGVFRVSDVVEEALQGLEYTIDFELRDQSAVPEEQFLGRYEAATRAVVAAPRDRLSGQQNRLRALCPVPADCTRLLEISQRQWQIAFAPSEIYPASTDYATWITLLAGLLLTSSLVLFLRSLQNELNRTRTLNDLKLRFFSMASHELRTPLSTILISTESLQANDAHWSIAQRRSTVERIHQTAQQMSQQISDLLTLTRAEVGKLDFNPELLDVAAWFQQLIIEVQPTICQLIELTTGPPVKAFWDKKLVRSLLTNLLSNAAKYSPVDSVIQVDLTSDDEQAILRVGDRGRGIPEADQPHVHQAFHRGSNVEGITGTGLGLAIVAVCVVQHRGDWHIDSKKGQGTTVTVTLPLE